MHIQTDSILVLIDCFLLPLPLGALKTQKGGMGDQISSMSLQEASQYMSTI